MSTETTYHRTPEAAIGDIHLSSPDRLGRIDLSESIQSTGGGETPAVTFADLTHSSEQRAKVLRRERAVLRVAELQRNGTGSELALQIVADELRADGVVGGSKSAVRRWVKRYQQFGTDGLCEQKQGVVGRRAVAIPSEILAQAAAASVEHGTLGVKGRQNFARAFRSVIVTHPDATSDMRDAFHSGYASKSYVPRSVRDSLRVSPSARDLAQGTRAYRLNSPYTPADWSQVKAGRVVTADDMTMNVYCWVEWPNAKGFLVVRPQLLAFLDCGTLRWLVARLVIRSNGQYNSDDVWGGIGDVADQYGRYPEYLFEGGIWRGNAVRGHRTGISDDERFGGLRTFGAILRHSHLPRSKPIEERFAQFQCAGDRLPGYAGRNEREDCPEATKKLLQAIKTDQIHPRGHLLHLSDLKKEVMATMQALNAERNDGVILRGMSPDEKWALDNPSFAIFPDSAKWLYRSTKSQVQVRRDGQLRVVVGSGRFQVAHLYRNADVLLPLAGRTVFVYWNQDHPEADAIILAGDTRRYLGSVQYVAPIHRFDGTKEQFAANAESLAAYRRYVRDEHISLAPHYLRQSVIPVDATTADNGDRLAAATTAAKEKTSAARRVSRAATVEITDELDGYRPRADAGSESLISEHDMAEITGQNPLT